MHSLRLHHFGLPINCCVQTNLSNYNWHTRNIYTLCTLLYFILTFTLYVKSPIKAVVDHTHSTSRVCFRFARTRVTKHQHSLTLFTHLSMTFFFFFVCVETSRRIGRERCACDCSSASRIPSQLLHLRDVLSASL